MVSDKCISNYIIILPTLLIALIIILFFTIPSTPLHPNFYEKSCPNVENIVRNVTQKQFQAFSSTIPSIINLYFHDCIVNGCDASVMIESTKNNTAEKDHPDNFSLGKDAYDTIIRAKEAIEAIPKCRGKVSCADILTIAVRDAITMVGGPWYQVELGRFDGLSSTAANVNRKLPQPTESFDKLVKYFAINGLTIDDMIALSGAHTVGIAYCGSIYERIYSSNKSTEEYPTIDAIYETQLRKLCPKNADPKKSIFMDPVTPTVFDNSYYKNLQHHRGLFRSDQYLYSNNQSRSLIDKFATDSQLFYQAFAKSMVKLGRVGVKTRYNGNIRRRCETLN